MHPSLSHLCPWVANHLSTLPTPSLPQCAPASPNLGAEFLETGPGVEEPMVTSVQPMQEREKS